MIEVNVERTALGEITSITMSGHADAGPYGYDLVCAAASALSFGTINAIMELCDVELLTTISDEGGYLHCEVPSDLNKTSSERVQLLLEGMLVSLQGIAEEYSEHICIQQGKF